MQYDPHAEQALLNDINRLEIVIDHCDRFIEELGDWLKDGKLWFLHKNITFMIAIVRDGKVDQVNALEQLREAAAKQKQAKEAEDNREYERAVR